MKKLMNDPGDLVVESLRGMEAAHGDILRVSYEPAYIVRADAPVRGKVGVLSGGGSGHEPMHGGYVGPGMLGAACPGAIFTSPTPDQIEEATRALDGGAGVIYLVKNYTGDVLNFESAAELCVSAGIPVETVIIDDDVAVQDSSFTAGRRGVGATVLIEKIVGAAAERGMGLAEVTGLARTLNEEARSMGVALSSCTVPEAGKPTFDLGADEIELGIGIHGEPGRERRTIRPARELVEYMSEAIFSDLPFHRGDSIIVLLNGMGGTPLIELYLLYGELERVARTRGLHIRRRLVGNYITSLEMQGFSMTALRSDDRILGLWDDPVHTASIRWGS
ncbi:MAG: dihydroxyacetone kinase subunit DhaK [Spirochaetaceae bacterium]|nr:MAG: dihydroxyacetone kinase subunit DhaK [Spirochaetaceae bacterium]